jgi:hypothetical protein
MKRIVFLLLLLVTFVPVPLFAQSDDCTDHDDHDGTEGSNSEWSCEVVLEPGENQNQSCYLSDAANPMTGRSHSGVNIYEFGGFLFGSVRCLGGATRSTNVPAIDGASCGRHMFGAAHGIECFDAGGVQHIAVCP